MNNQRRPRLFTRREMVQGLATAPVAGVMLRAARAAAEGVGGVRFCTVVFPNGVHPDWAPPETGSSFTLPQHIAPLEGIRSKVIILKGLRHAAGGHNNGTQAILTGWDAHKQPGNEGPNYNTWLCKTPSIDQVIADRIAAGPGRPPIHSLQLASMADIGSGDGGRIVFTTANPAVPIAPEQSPLNVYQKLSAKLVGGVGVDPAQLQLALQARKSVLDSVRGDLGTIRRSMSPAECVQCDAYETALRSVESGLGGTFTPPSAATCKATTAQMPPAGKVTRSNLTDYPKFLHMHLDLIALAFACGLTRVVTLQLGEGSTKYPMPWIGYGSGDFHGVTHYRIQPAGLAYNQADSDRRISWTIKGQQYWTQELVNLATRLDAIPEGPGKTVLDNSIVLLATLNGDSNIHSPDNPPYVFAGSAGGRFKTGRVVDCGGRYNNDVLVSIANAMGLADVTRFGDSHCMGALPGLLG